MGLAAPEKTYARHVVMGKTFDPGKPEEYVNGFSIRTTRSGLASFALAGAGAGCADTGSPSGAPAAAHRARVSISGFVSALAPSKSPYPGSGFQGGM